jgi:hypothetical protein
MHTARTLISPEVFDVEDSPEFKADPYIDRLLELKYSDPARFATLTEPVRKFLAEYERKKKEAELKGTPESQ